MATSPTGVREPSASGILLAILASLIFVAATRLPVARTSAFDSDEVGYLAMLEKADFPMHHTLFLASAKAIGQVAGDPYRGFLILDMATSALALASIWWLLRGIVPPTTAAVGTLALGVGPVFWAYGSMAANYTAIVLVGSILLGIAVRGRTAPRMLHPHIAAVVLGLGTGYRQDIGLFWLPVFFVILWQHRWIPALQAAMIFAIINFAWLVPMLRDAGGWKLYREETGKFAHKAGYMNSIWQLGWIDATVRYTVKIGLALGWTLGLGLLFVPVGLVRLSRRDGGPFLIALMVLAAIPALAMHLLVHFGVAGYSFHYIPALVVLMAIGFAPSPDRERVGIVRGLIVAGSLAALFLLYPTDLSRRDFRGQFDLACARHTRIGLATRQPSYDTDLWRTSGSQRLPGNTVPPPARPRQSLLQIWPADDALEPTR